MNRVCLLVTVILLIGGCSEPVPHPASFPVPELSELAGEELWKQFEEADFDWTQGTADWSKMNPGERSEALGINAMGYIRWQSENEKVRINEYYADKGVLASRRQMELHLGKWQPTGPEIIYHDDGTFEVGFQIKGKEEGPRVKYNFEGTELSRQIFKEGEPVSPTDSTN